LLYVTGKTTGQIDELPLSTIEREIVQGKQQNLVSYRYDSIDELQFELDIRLAIIAAARALYGSGVGFATFEDSRCNPLYWNLTRTGGFRLRDDVKPSDAINDIYANGTLYAFECATAILIIMYKAVLDVLGAELFDRHFQELYLRDWHSDSELRLVVTNNKLAAYPGDVVYFKNPDHDPEMPEWQGENAVMLGNGLYFGHGLGIETADKIIATLNTLRIPDSTTSAYMLDLVVTPDFDLLHGLTKGVRLTAAGLNV